MKTVEVVAALLCRGNRFLICRRPQHKARAGLYEFPGGKVESGETPQAALARECIEELNIRPMVCEPVQDVYHTYPDLTIHLTLYRAEVPVGEPQSLEHDDLQWITLSQLDAYPFCPADISFHAAIRKLPQLMEQ